MGKVFDNAGFCKVMYIFVRLNSVLEVVKLIL